MLMHYEIEQKFAIADRTALEERLRSLGAKELGQVEQADQYFNHPARDFAQTDEALRIRRVGRASFVTYKGPKLDQTTKSRRELELPLGSDETTAAQFAEMLVALGFRPVAEVRKSRENLRPLGMAGRLKWRWTTWPAWDGLRNWKYRLATWANPTKSSKPKRASPVWRQHSGWSKTNEGAIWSCCWRNVER